MEAIRSRIGSIDTEPRGASSASNLAERGSASLKGDSGLVRHEPDLAEEQVLAGLVGHPVEVAVGLEGGEPVQRRPRVQPGLIAEDLVERVPEALGAAMN